MRPGTARIKLILGTLLLLLIQPPLAAADEITFSRCDLQGPQGIGLVQADCTTLQLPENPDVPGGAQVAIRIAKIDSLSPEPATDAFTVINGGPGGSSLSLYAQSAAVFAGILRERDIIVVDQRGTGESSPLECEGQEDLVEDFDRELLIEATRTCLEQLKHDPRFFTTSVAVRDLNTIRKRLGYEALTIYGVSYGTRVALHYARRFPEHTRALVIDGVVPPNIALGPNAALNAQRALNRLIARCSNDAACETTFPELSQKLQQLLESLASNPVSVDIADPLTGEMREISIGPGHLALTLRMLSYAPETAALIPLIINQAAVAGDYRPVAANALRIVGELEGAISTGMHNAVVCAEDIPFLGQIDWSALDATYLGSVQSQALLTICEHWPSGSVDPDIKDPLHSAIPTLVLSGEEDPITPPEYGEQVMESLSQALHIVGPGQGHGIFNRGCVPRLVNKFVETTDLAALDTRCVERLKPKPFFLDTLGPAP
jgi:pimeloyl-ACP methyl ester carboxylesterase